MRHLVALLLALCAGSSFAQLCTTSAPCTARIQHITSPGGRVAYGCAATGACTAIENAITAQVAALNTALAASGITNVTVVNAGIHHSNNRWYDANSNGRVASDLWQDPAAMNARNGISGGADISVAIKGGASGSTAEDRAAACSTITAAAFQCGGAAVNAADMLDANAHAYEHAIMHPFGGDHENADAGTGRASWWRTREPCPQGDNTFCAPDRATKCFHTIGTASHGMPLDSVAQTCNGWSEGSWGSPPNKFVCSPQEFCDDAAVFNRAQLPSNYFTSGYGKIIKGSGNPPSYTCEPTGWYAVGNPPRLALIGGNQINMGTGSIATVPAGQYANCTGANTTALPLFSNPDKSWQGMPTGRSNYSNAASKFTGNAPYVTNWKTLGPVRIWTVPLK